MARVPVVPLRPELRRLRERAEAGGHGTMAYQLLCARIEADRQIRQAEEDAADVPARERWVPIERDDRAHAQKGTAGSRED